MPRRTKTQPASDWMPKSRPLQIQIASGDEGDVRPSDWLKLKLGNVMGMEQDTWDDDWKPPASIQAFTMGVFASMGTVVDRVGDTFS